MTLRPVLISVRPASPLVLLALCLAAIPVLQSGSTAVAAEADGSSEKRWAPAELANGVEAALARVASSELSTRYVERRNTNAYGKGDAVFASGTGRSLFRADGTRWYCDDDGFTTSFGKPGATPRRLESGFDGTVHFEKDRFIVTYGEDNLSVWQYSPGLVFWGAGRDTDFLLGRLRDEYAKVVRDETVDGRRQVTVKVAWHWGETAYEYQVTLLPDHSFLPVDAHVNVNGELDAEWSTSGLKQADGFWYPSKVTHKRFQKNTVERDKRTTVTAFRLRDDFEDSEFMLDSTISLDIVDRRTGTAFHNDPWWHDLAPFLRQRLNWPQRDMHSANDYAKYGNDDLIDKSAPDLSVAEWINGEPTALTAPDRNLTLLIFFGGRAISPSPRTLAALNNLRDVYHKNGLEVIGVASASDTLDLARRDVKSLQLSFPVAIDNPNDDPDGNRYGKTFQTYGLKSYYGFFLIDGDGQVLKLRPSKDLLSDIGKKPGIGGDFDLRTNVIRVLFDAGERDLACGEGDLLQLDLPQINIIEPEWKRLLKNSPRTAQLTGTITDGENPIAGATIQATPTLKQLFSFSPGGYFLSVDRDQRFTFKTDDEGHFDAGGLPKGVWQLLIRKPGHASLEKNVTLATSQSAVELNIENQQKDRIFGRVLDQKGDPVVRASVQVDKRHPDPERPTITTTAHLPKQKAVTDQEGRFEITRLYDGTYTLSATAANFEHAVEQHVSADGRELIIRLKPATRTTSQTGRRSLRPGPPGVQSPALNAPFTGFAQIAEAASLPLVEDPPGPRTVSGIVIDEAGLPLAGAVAVVQTHSGAVADRTIVEAAATSDERGQFTIQLPQTFFQAALQRTPAKDRLDCPMTLWAPGRSIVTRSVTLKKTADWRAEVAPVSLVRGSDIALRVLSPENEVISGAKVCIDGWFAGGFVTLPKSIQSSLTAMADDNGIVHFSGLVQPQMWLVVTTTTKSSGAQSSRHRIVTPPDHIFDLKLAAGGSVTGRIRCSNPEELARLKLVVATETDARFRNQFDVFIDRGRSSQIEVQPDGDGTFKVSGLTPGRLSVRQVIDEKSTWRLKALPIPQTVEPDKVTEFVADLLPGTQITGFVIDKQNGELLADSMVEIHGLHVQQFRRVAAEPIPLHAVSDGRFQCVVLPGQYQVTAKTMIPGFSRIKVEQLEVKPDQENVEVKVFVPRTLSMQAELVDEDGLPVGNAWVAAKSGKKVLTLKRASDVGIFEAWLADVARADSWQVRIGKRRLKATVINRIPLKLKVPLTPDLELPPLPIDKKARLTDREQGLQLPADTAAPFSGFAYVADSERHAPGRYSSHGYVLYPADSDDVMRNNQVFVSGKFPELLQGLWQASGNATLPESNAHPATFLQTLITQKNGWFGVAGGKPVRVLWSYLNPVQDWVEKLQPDVQKLVGSTRHFPNYPTLDTHLAATEVNLLASLTAWCVGDESNSQAFTSLFAP